MAKHYLDRLSAIVDRTLSNRLRGVEMECRHFFSGAALYANGIICASLTPVGLAVKLPEPSRAHLLKSRRGRPLRYFASGPIKKEYVVLARVIVDNPARLRRWLLACIENAVSQQRT